MTENGFVTKDVDIASISEIQNGSVYTVNNIEEDGIYTITSTVVDKAGNEFSEVSLQREDGSTYIVNKTAVDSLLSFSVNREGSTFDVNDATKKIVENYYVYSVNDDIVVYEINTNELLSYTVTLNGEELQAGTDYTVTTEGGNGSWMRYIYTINKELFEAEGEYVIVVSSTDSAENNAFSDIKNANISFVVDRTAPIVTVSGLADNASYNVEKQMVSIIPTDDGG